jgi:hypothetical protein
VNGILVTMSFDYLPTFLYSQFLVTPHYPTYDFTNQVIIGECRPHARMRMPC